MTVLFNIFAILHFIGWAIVLGGYFATLRKPGLPAGVFHGAATALVAGIVMMGLAEGPLDYDVNQGKLGAKLLIALVITVLAFYAQKKGDRCPAWVKHAVGILTIVNIVIAVVVH